MGGSRRAMLPVRSDKFFFVKVCTENLAVSSVYLRQILRDETTWRDMLILSISQPWPRSHQPQQPSQL